MRDRVEALNVGADDFMPKPFSIEELLTRVRAHLLREAYHRAQGDRDQPKLADQCVNTATRFALSSRHTSRSKSRCLSA